MKLEFEEGTNTPVIYSHHERCGRLMIGQIIRGPYAYLTQRNYSAEELRSIVAEMDRLSAPAREEGGWRYFKWTQPQAPYHYRLGDAVEVWDEVSKTWRFSVAWKPHHILDESKFEEISREKAES